ncbi:MAG: translational GTPase TypA [Planctomycetota bacterium]|jgi:GTP-binding protein
MTRQPRALRNVAIIAHVDHGKTTLVDALLTHSGTVADLDDGVCVLDSNPLERERGITILSKNCGVELVAAKGPFAGERIRVNIIDTPGHADFGGEVERVLRMADGALLLVDAAEGPMPQTRHVLAKALELGMKPIVVVNKCDRPDARPDAVVDEVFDLLVDLDADEAALDFPTIYASGRQGWAGRTLDPRPEGIEELVEEILERVPPPSDDPEGPLQMLVTTLDSSEYTGRIAIGRVFSGVLKAGETVGVCRRDGGVVKMRPVKVLRFEGLGRVPTDRVEAGDLCALEGLPGVEIGDTIGDIDDPKPLPRVSVDEPTLDMIFRINDSPFAGREGRFVTSRQIAERLDRELERNVALRVAPGDSTDEFRVSGRGMLHLGVLLETMRREGYELAVGKPEVIEREIDGVRCEPVERLTLDTAGEATGPAMELLGSRGAEVVKMELRGERMHVEAEIPARGLIGLRTRLLNATGGEAIMHHSFADWRPVRSAVRRRGNGVMVANEQGTATTYALLQLSERGVMFVKPGDPIYAGQIVGESSREGDMTVNAARAKAFSNVRETSKDATVVLKQPREITLEAALEYIESDELVEITPTAVRLRKRLLSESERRRGDRAAKSRAEALSKP